MGRRHKATPAGRNAIRGIGAAKAANIVTANNVMVSNVVASSGVASSASTGRAGIAIVRRPMQARHDRQDRRPDRREKAPDPNSPFAKLAALKAQLEAEAKERR